ncbi:Noc2p family-domain-containing protein [Chlamydoabsidia padenii]|nr:Noc2p family-domain-containing protein [Chlamydoabsidia padenii]
MAKSNKGNSTKHNKKTSRSTKKVEKGSAGVLKTQKDKKAKTKAVEKSASMSVEDFFNGGFAVNSDDDNALDQELQQLEQVPIEESNDDDDDEFLKITTPPKPTKEDIDEPMEDANESSQSEEEEEEEEEEELDNVEATDNNDDEDDEILVTPEGADNDDEDIDNSSDDDNGDSKEKLLRDAKKHKLEMEELKKRDPEFYKFLEKEDADLLGFDMSEDEDEDEDDNDNNKDDNDEDQEFGSGDEEDDQESNMQNDKSLVTVTKEMLANWVDQIETKCDSKAAKRLFAAFKSATRMADEEEREKTTFIYKVIDPNVFNSVLTSAMHYAPIVFKRYLTPKNEGGSPRSSPRWKMWQTQVKAYLTSLLYLMKSLTDSNMQYLAIHEAEKCTAYWACFEKQAKDYLKILLDYYSGLGSADNVRIQSFLAIRTLASSRVTTRNNAEAPFLDTCLKNLYLTFVRSCKLTNIHTLPAINLMRNLAVELYGFDQITSYQQAFVYIRQLAIHLRGAMQTKSDETFKSVYNWQYVHCIDFWSNVLSSYCQPVEGEEDSPLKSLVYPLTQVALGAVRLIPTAQYYPLRFHILKSMASLCDATKVYIPLAPYILEILDSAEMKNKAKPSTAKPLDWDIHLRAPKPYLRGRTYQDGIIDQVTEVLTACFKPYFHHISFPEMAIPSIIAVKRFAKKSKNAKGSRKLLDLVKMLEVKSNAILIQRTQIDFAPNSDQARQYAFA